MTDLERRTLDLAVRWFEIVWCQSHPGGSEPRMWDDTRREMQSRRAAVEEELYRTAEALRVERGKEALPR